MGRYLFIDQFFGKPEHSTKWSYVVLTQRRQCAYYITFNSKNSDNNNNNNYNNIIILI